MQEKWMIASDIHGSAACCRRLLERLEEEGASRLLLLGDLLYHGPRNDLPEEYDPKKVCEMLNSHRQQLLCVHGNCDADVDQMVLDFPITADYAILQLQGHTIHATHGHLWDKAAPPPLVEGDILLCGHTHLPAWEACDGFIYLNPGSTSLPKEGSPRSYMTLSEGLFCWKELDTGKEYHRWQPV